MNASHYLGIEDYVPAWQQGVRAIAATHGRRLASLVGRRLTHTWLAWDRETDEWFNDAPVLLDFTGEQLEIQHQKFDELSLTWNTTDPMRRISFPEFDLAWRADAQLDLVRLEGLVVRDIRLLEWRGGDMADGMVAVFLAFDGGTLTIYNALDENGLSFEPPLAQYAALGLR